MEELLKKMVNPSLNVFYEHKKPCEDMRYNDFNTYKKVFCGKITVTHSLARLTALLFPKLDVPTVFYTKVT